MKEIEKRRESGEESKGEKKRKITGAHHWKEETERDCRICEKEEESLRYILKECEATKDEISMEEFLSEEGNGLNIMRKIDKIREKKRMEETNAIANRENPGCKEG